jgi:predicted phage tail protein
MLREICLYGAARQYGDRFRLDVDSPAEAIRALIMLRPGLRRLIREGVWRVIVGPPRVRNSIGVDCLNMNAGHQPLHLVPATRPAGGGRGKAIGGIIAGVVLIGAAIAFPATIGAAAGFIGMSTGSVVLMGASMVLGGMSSLLVQPPTPDAATDRAAPDDRPSFLFNGVTNNSQQGGPVPLVFGTHLVGSVVINASLNAEDIPYTAPPSSPGSGKWPFA